MRADDGGALLAGGEQHVDLGGAVDHVEVRDDVAAIVDHDAGADIARLRDDALLVAARHAVGNHRDHGGQHALDRLLEAFGAGDRYGGCLGGRGGRDGRGRHRLLGRLASAGRDDHDEAAGESAGQPCREGEEE